MASTGSPRSPYDSFEAWSVATVQGSKIAARSQNDRDLWNTYMLHLKRERDDAFFLGTDGDGDNAPPPRQPTPRRDGTGDEVRGTGGGGDNAPPLRLVTPKRNVTGVPGASKKRIREDERDETEGFRFEVEPPKSAKPLLDALMENEELRPELIPEVFLNLTCKDSIPEFRSMSISSRVAFEAWCQEASGSVGQKKGRTTILQHQHLQGYKADVKPRFHSYDFPVKDSVEHRIVQRSGYSHPLDIDARENFPLLAREPHQFFIHFFKFDDLTERVMGWWQNHAYPAGSLQPAHVSKTELRKRQQMHRLLDVAKVTWPLLCRHYRGDTDALYKYANCFLGNFEEIIADVEVKRMSCDHAVWPAKESSLTQPDSGLPLWYYRKAENDERLKPKSAQTKKEKEKNERPSSP